LGKLYESPTLSAQTVGILDRKIPLAKKGRILGKSNIVFGAFSKNHGIRQRRRF
jgi:hypothetical protein